MARISVYNDHPSLRNIRLYTDLDGRFEWNGDLPGGPRTLWVTGAGRDTAATVELAEDLDLSAPVEIKLVQSCTLTGWVHDDQDKPVFHATVWLIEELGNESRPLVWTKTDERGNYRLRGFVLSEHAHTIKVQPDLEYQPDRTVQINGYPLELIKPGEAIDRINFRLTSNGHFDRIDAEPKE